VAAERGLDLLVHAPTPDAPSDLEQTGGAPHLVRAPAALPELVDAIDLFEAELVPLAGRVERFAALPSGGGARKSL
jgi:hypothetical protein